MGLPLIACENKQWNVIHMIEEKAVFSDLFLVPKINEERR